PVRPEQEKARRGYSPDPAAPNAARECVVSWSCLHRLSVGVEFAYQRIAIFFRCGCEMGDKGLDQFTAGAAKCRGAAEVCGIGLHEIRIEVVLADQKAELIAEPGLAGAISVGRLRTVRRRRNSSLSRRARERTQLFDRAEA